MLRITEVTPADEAKIVDNICAMIDTAREHVTAEASWHRLEEFFFEQLARGTDLSASIVDWARAGHPAAHRAIWRFARAMGERGRFDEMFVSIRAYVLNAPEQAFIPYPRGRHVVQNLTRDIWLPLVVAHVADCTGLPPTRSSSTAAPSAAYFVSRAMKTRGIKLKERAVNQIFWDRHKVAARLEASMPAVLDGAGIPSTLK
jgi:hypothetical protein